jgi:hypothetical protein
VSDTLMSRTDSLTIKQIVDEAYSCAREHGWYDTPATFGDRIALVHSELSEALEAFRVLDSESYDAIREPLYKGLSGGLVRHGKEYIQGDSDMTVTILKPEGVWSELADAVIRIADMCGPKQSNKGKDGVQPYPSLPSWEQTTLTKNI